MNWPTSVLLGLWLALAKASAAAESLPVSGYFGDRSGVYRNANPPVRWSEETNVLWKVAVPNLGNGGPVAGKEIKLTWSTVNATKVRIEPGIGEVPTQGEHALQLDQPATYTLTAEGPVGPAIRKVTINVKPAPAKQ